MVGIYRYFCIDTALYFFHNLSRIVCFRYYGNCSRCSRFCDIPAKMTKSLTSRRKEKYLFCCTFLFVLTLFVSVQNSMCTRNDTSNCFPPPNQGEVHQIEGSFTQLRGPSHTRGELHQIKEKFTKLRGPSHNWGVLHTIEGSFTHSWGTSSNRGEVHQIEGPSSNQGVLHQIEGTFTKSRGPSPNRGVERERVLCVIE